MTLLLLALGLVPLPGGLARSLRQSARSLEPNTIDREAVAGSYYEGLINVGGDGTRSELALRLLGKPTHGMDFNEVGATHYLTGDPLQFELYPNVHRRAFGREFSTNAHGLRDREYTREKPPGVFRIVLLGASMDMGWGVSTPNTYENRFEDWLNAYAAKHGLGRRFEVLNFAVAAYSPLHRLESLRRKALAFDPDMVICSGTLLDPRLLEINLCNLIQDRIEPPDAFVRQALARANLTASDLARDTKGGLARKEAIKAKLRPALWSLIGDVLGAVADICRRRDIPLLCIVIPRAGGADNPDDRGPGVTRYRALAARHGLPILDLTPSFDGEDPADVEIAPWDDHPNDLGHKLLFYALADRVLKDKAICRAVFGKEWEDP